MLGRAGLRLAVLVAAAGIIALLAAPVAAIEGPTGLSVPSVSPRTGTPDTPITFEVTYRNHEGSEPAWVRVVIDGDSFAMSAHGSDWKEGVRFTLVTTLSVGTHSVVFEAADSRKFTDSLDAGTVVIEAPTPAPTPTPTPAPTLAPTLAPTPTPTPIPTASPVATVMPTAPPTATPPPTASPTATPTPAPVAAGGTVSGGGPTGSGGSTDGHVTAGTSESSADSRAPSTAVSDGLRSGGLPGVPAAGLPDGTASNGTPPDGVSLDAAASGGPDDQERSQAAFLGGSTSGGTHPATLSPGLRALGLGGPEIPLAVRLAVQTIVTTGGVTLAMALFAFRKRRHDGEQPEPDEVLRSKAGRPTPPVSSSTLVPDGGPFLPAPAAAPASGPAAEELSLPRWRRPSLMQARKTDPLRSATVEQHLSFDHGLVDPLEGRERRRLRYRLVRLLDQPDELRGNEIGFLDQGDEVQLLQQAGAYWLVLCPDGSRGWLHKMTLGEVVEDDLPVRLESRRRSFVDEPETTAPARAPRPADPVEPTGTSGSQAASDGVDDDVLRAFLSRRRTG